jgi:geranylgeranyl diphosphate synthase type I
MTDVSARLVSVRDRIDRRLVAYLKDKLAEVRATSPDSVELAEGIDDLTMRGGKRLRPIVLDAAYRAVKPDGVDDASTGVGAALEVLQSYLLIHDDWMDQDDERRGGPAVHKIYERKYETHVAASLAILAGDLACAYAWELFFESPFPAHRQAEANARFVTIQKEVIVGQHLDCTANPDVSRMHDLKTGSYTVRGPLMLGALLGDATKEQIDALLAWGNPLGEAFQLADDLLGTFGDLEKTGKPGDDLPHRKRTSLVAECERLLPVGRRDALDRLMSGKGEPSEAEVAAAAELLVTSGAKANVEKRLHELHAKATAVLESAPLDREGVAVLRHVADKLALRTS